MTSNAPTYRDGVQMLRMVHLLEHSANRELSADRLAEKLEVSRRTVLRYAEALQSDRVEPGTPSLTRFRRDGASWLRLDGEDHPIDTRVFQYAVTFAGLQIFLAGGGSLLSDTTDLVLKRMRADLGTRRADLLPRARTAFLHVPFGPKQYRQHDDTLDDLLQALLECHPVRAKYRDRHGHQVEREFEPYTVVLYRDGLYVLGRLEEPCGQARWRLFAVDRLSDASIVKDKRFGVPEDFDPGFLFKKGAVGLWPTDADPEVLRLAFAPDVATGVRERQWPDARWEERADGWHVLQMRVVVTPEIIAWILSWGASVEVLAPETVRYRIMDNARRVVDRHPSTSAVS